MSYYWREITEDAPIAVSSWRPDQLMRRVWIIGTLKLSPNAH